MKKFTYILICFLLSINFWNLTYITEFLSNDIILVLTWLWAFSSFIFFRGKSRLKFLYSDKYVKYMYVIFLGVFISMFSAYLFWEQNLLITFVAQRWVYSFILLPALLYVQPTEKDIVKALKWITIGTVVVWCISIVAPELIGSISEEAIARRPDIDFSDIGYNVAGIQYVVLYLYIKIHSYIKKFSLNIFLQASALLMFLILFQNRSLLIGAILVYLYSFIRFKSKYKTGLILLQAILLIVGIIYTWEIWTSLLVESQGQLSNADYNRWKALAYYFQDYSPNWFCYAFGNGMPSGPNSGLGKLMWDNMENGIYASDLGMIGMWTAYGLLPLISIYVIIFKVLLNKKYPLYLKFISFHVLLVPTIFNFWRNPGILFFVLIIYLFAYNRELNKIFKYYALNNNSKL